MNSTEQILQTKSKNLRSQSCQPESYVSPVKSNNLDIYDRKNLYKTSYDVMNSHFPNKNSNNYILPNYGGFVPGMKSENPFAHTFTVLAQQEFNKFDMRRSQQLQNQPFVESRYRPMSKLIGSFWKKGGNNGQYSTQFRDLPYDPYLSDSGYSINLKAKSPVGFFDPSIAGSNKKTEYRVNFNTKKDFQYKVPMFSTGFIKNNGYNPTLD